MHVTRLGLTPVKGMAHTPLTQLELTPDGPLHDREFCVLETASGRVLRTVENDVAMACVASWQPPVLTIRTPQGKATGEVPDVPAAGAVFTGSYWARTIRLAAVDGPWTTLLSRYFGQSVLLCRVLGARRAVWAGPVSLVTTSSLTELARRIGRDNDDGARFRATMVIDTGDAPPFVEDTWVGRTLRVGRAAVTVDERLPRCAVVDRRPAAGGLDARVLAALAPDRRDRAEIMFGVAGAVELPGPVSLSDAVSVGDGHGAVGAPSVR